MVQTFLPNPNLRTQPLDIIIESAAILDRERLQSSLNEGGGQILPAIYNLELVSQCLNIISTKYYQYYYHVRRVRQVYNSLNHVLCLRQPNVYNSDVYWLPKSELNGTQEGIITDAWWSHPAVLMWYGHSDALSMYLHILNQEWIKRGYQTFNFKRQLPSPAATIVWPEWFTDQRFFLSHRYSLYQKNPEHYTHYFNQEQYQLWLNIMQQVHNFDTILPVKLANDNYFWPRTPHFLQLE